MVGFSALSGVGVVEFRGNACPTARGGPSGNTEDAAGGHIFWPACFEVDAIFAESLAASSFSAFAAGMTGERGTPALGGGASVFERGAGSLDRPRFGTTVFERGEVAVEA